ncbi:MAG: chemotaxis protein [Candidatus Margulisbacteria bacterium]|nr:chemotaxis protein [Candidatus Margulisiibacteriota bacterium]
MEKHALETVKVTDNAMELIDFRLVKKNDKDKIQEMIFGINVYKVKEVIFKPEHIFKVPSDTECLEGMVNLRGKVIPVINLQKKLGYNTNEYNTDYLVITEFNQVTCGFMVNQIKKIRRFSWQDMITPPPEIRSQYGDLITSITLLEGGDIMLILDFEKIIADMNADYYNNAIDWSKVKKTQDSHTIMCVDDSSVARKMAKKALEEAGYKVIDAVNGVEALQILKSLAEETTKNNESILNKINAIICDIEMPLMDGFTFTKTLKENPALNPIPVILHSSLSRTVLSGKGENVGAIDFLTKFNSTTLIEAVSKVT